MLAPKLIPPLPALTLVTLLPILEPSVKAVVEPAVALVPTLIVCVLPLPAAEPIEIVLVAVDWPSVIVPVSVVLPRVMVPAATDGVTDSEPFELTASKGVPTPLALTSRISTLWLAAPAMTAAILPEAALWILKLAVWELVWFRIKSVPDVSSKPQAAALCRQTVPDASGRIIEGSVATVLNARVPRCAPLVLASCPAVKAYGKAVSKMLWPASCISPSQLGLPLVPPIFIVSHSCWSQLIAGKAVTLPRLTEK